MSDAAEPSEVEQVIAERFGAQLRACTRLRAFAESLADPWRGRALEAEPGNDLIIFALFSRSLNTHSAAVEVAARGYGEQAAMLNRSLFEDMVDAHWTADEPDLSVQLLRDHAKHSRMLNADAAAKYPDFIDPADIPAVDPEERTRLNELFGPFGTSSWTRINIHKRAELVAHHWTDIGADTQALFFYRDIAQRENNQTLHVTAQGLGATVRARDENSITFRLGPDVDMIGRALFGAFWIFAQTVGLLIDHFNVQIDPAERTAATDTTEFGPDDTTAAS